MTTLEFLIFFSALWRLTNIMIFESGPFHIFVWIRELAGITHTDDFKPSEYPETWFADLFGCPWCLSLALAFPYAAVIYFWRDWTFWLSFPFSLSAFSILLWKVIQWLEQQQKQN